MWQMCFTDESLRGFWNRMQDIRIMDTESNPTVKTRGGKCSIVVGSNRPLPSKSALPRKPDASEKKRNYSHTVRYAMRPYAGHAMQRPVLISTIGFGRMACSRQSRTQRHNRKNRFQVAPRIKGDDRLKQTGLPR